MTRNFNKHTAKVLNKPFVAGNNNFEKTVEISFFDDKGNEIERIELAHVTKEDIYKKIDNGADIIFGNCYIEGFSLSDYRVSRKKEPDEQLVLNNFFAEGSIFHSGKETSIIDFSYSDFHGEASFKNCIFSDADTLLFDFSHFKNNVWFDNALFHNLDVSFSNSGFGFGNVCFKNVIFREGYKKFENIKFGDGEVLFLNAEFNNGDVIYTNSKFGKGKVSFKVARFGTGRKDFSKVDFGQGEIVFEKVEFGDGNVNFRNTIFGKQKVEFTRCEFGVGDISFIGANFGDGDVSFAGTEFGNGKLSFKQAYFGIGKLDFHYAHFGVGDVIFERTYFSEGVVDFRAVDFGIGRITFNRALFGDGEVIFEASELKKGRITFRRTIFGVGIFNFEMANFKNAELIIDDVNFGQGKVSFKQSKFGLLSLESSQMNNYFDLRVEECGKLDLSNTIVKDIIDIDSSDFKTDIKALDLSGIRLLGRIYIDWKHNDVKNLILNQNTSNYNKAEQFRVLKENYNLIGQYDYEDGAYVEFKRLESKSQLDEAQVKKLIPRVWDNISYFFRLLVFDKVGLYATNPIRVLLSMTVVFLFFSLVYIILPLVLHDTQIISSLFDAGDPRDLSLVEKGF
ncbi:MAG: hypothetical protein B6I20_07510, partial [Bacteroidetes bacterium 4572_117]